MNRRIIVADSSCDITEMKNYERVPMIININQKDYIDIQELNKKQMMQDTLSSTEKSISSCPSPYSWYNIAKDYDEIFFVPITSALSGSYNSASIAKNMLEDEEKKVFLCDSLTASAGMDLIVKKLGKLIEEGKTFEEIEKEDFSTKLNFVLTSIDNFVKNGRVPKIVGSAFNVLNISLIGEDKEGKLNPIGRARTIEKGLNRIVSEMEKNGYHGGNVAISHAFSPESAEKMKKKIKEKFGNVPIEIYPMSGINLFYTGNGSIIVGYEK